MNKVNIFITLKQAGKRKATVAAVPMQLPLTHQNSVQGIIEALVKIQVTAFNQAVIDSSPDIDTITSQRFIPMQIQEDKIHFNIKYHQKTVLLEDAIKIALLAFHDGLFAIFVDEVPYTSLYEFVPINEGTHLTIIKLSFLTGSYW